MPFPKPDPAPVIRTDLLMEVFPSDRVPSKACDIVADYDTTYGNR